MLIENIADINYKKASYQPDKRVTTALDFDIGTMLAVKTVILFYFLCIYINNLL